MKELTKIILNSSIAGALIFFGAAATELQEHGFDDLKGLSLGLCLGIITGFIVFLTKWQQYMNTPKNKKGSFRILDFI